MFRAEPEALGTRSGERYRVLVIDDIEADDYVEWLDSDIFDARAAYRADAGLQAISEFCPDLVLLDVDFGDEGTEAGLELLRQIKREPATRSILVVMLTKFGGDHAELALKAGADNFARKLTVSPGPLALTLLAHLKARDAARHEAREETLRTLGMSLAHDLGNRTFYAMQVVCEAEQGLITPEFVECAKEDLAIVAVLVQAWQQAAEGQSKPGQLEAAWQTVEGASRRRLQTLEIQCARLTDLGTIPAVTATEADLILWLSELVENFRREVFCARAEQQPIAEPRIEFSAAVQGDCVVVVAADNGRGVPDPMKEKIFTAGAPHRVQGAGDKARPALGLRAIRERVRWLGGDLWVEDNLPRGARFVLRLPIAKV